MQMERETTPNDTVSPVTEPPRESYGNSAQPEHSLGELFSELANDMTVLVRQEVELARTETMEKVSTATRSVMMMVVGGLLAYAGLVALVIAAAIALGAMMPYWLSALIVGVVVIIIGAGILMSGRSSLTNINPVPEKTVETLKEDAKWAKEQVQ
jgi:uncharacterized membrane protein YqjE